MAEESSIPSPGKTGKSGVWAELHDRVKFAATDHEQRFETNLVGGRALYTQILTYPSTIIQNAILRPDLAKAKKDGGKSSWFNGAAAYNFADKWLFQGVGGQVVRSVTTGYAKHEHYITAKDAAERLVELASAAEAQNDGPALSRQIAAGKQSVLGELFSHSQEAGQLLEQFISGKLPITPNNLTRLNTAFAGLAELSHARAEMLDAYAGLAENPAPAEGHQPADYIREVVEKPQLENLRDAQIFLGFTASLLAESALPFSSEIYIPQEEIFLTQEQNKALSKAISTRLEQLGLSKDGAQPQAEDILNFANELHAELMQAKGVDIRRLLDFADKRFNDIENNLAHHAAAKETRVQATPEIHVGNKGERITANERDSRETDGLGRDTARLIGAEAKFLTRSHMGTEIKKLYGRLLANQIMAFPVNVLEEALRNFFKTSQEGKPKAGFDAMLDKMRGKPTEMTQLFDGGAFKNNLLSNGYRMVMQPLIGAQGTVLLQEGSRVKAALAVDASKRSSPFVAAAIRSGQRYVPQMAERLEQAGGMHPAFATLLRHPDYDGRIAPLLQQDGTKPLQADDYRLLAKFFDDMGKATVNVAEEVLSPFQDGAGVQRIQSMDEVTKRIFDKPIENVPDAMIALAFAESFIQNSRDKIEMIEYVDPDGVMLKPGALKELSYFIEDEAIRLGLKPQGEKGHETLIQNGQPVSKEALVSLAQSVMHKLNDCVSLPMLLGSMKGQLREDVAAGMEERLFAGATFETGAANVASSSTTAVDVALTTPWAEKVKRPKEKTLANINARWNHPEVAHERQKLFDRLGGSKLIGATSTVIYKSLQHGTKALDRGNLVVAAWTYFAHPSIYGKGIVQIREAGEEILFHKRSTLNDANQAVDLAGAAVKAAGFVDPRLSQRLDAFSASNLHLDTLEAEAQYKDIARIASKPRSERTAEDDGVMEAYYQQSGDKLLQVAGGLLSSLGGGTRKETFAEAVQRVTERPVDNMTDAVIGLSFLASLIHQNAHYADKMTYTAPKEITLDKKALGTLSGFMADQAYAAGFMVSDGTLTGKEGQPASQEDIIRFANVALGKFRSILEQRPELANRLGEQLEASKHQNLLQKSKLVAIGIGI